MKDAPVFVSAVKKNLAEAVHDYGEEPQCFLIGMNMLPGFIGRDLAEVSLFRNDEQKLQNVMQQLGWKYRVVADRVGLITPRIICMIINEACYTLQEGTAKVADIDLSMKLGTNYPYGPFEWAEKIGIKDVYETLLAIYADTHDERYKICPLLKEKYLRGENFLSGKV
jgi:3-hydroxybutyryl-CoA dehydrogenase